MNPLKWKKEYQVAGCAICVLGIIVGLVYAWDGSIASRIASSGKLNPSMVFFTWLQNPSQYWPWPLLGGLFAGLSFYTIRLLKDAKQ